MTESQTFAPAPDVVVRDLEGEAVVLDLATGTYYGLNETGTRMWQLLEQHGSLPAVVDALVNEFDAPADRLEADLRALVSRLVEKGLLRAVPGSDDAR